MCVWFSARGLKSWIQPLGVWLWSWWAFCVTGARIPVLLIAQRTVPEIVRTITRLPSKSNQLKGEKWKLFDGLIRTRQYSEPVCGFVHRPVGFLSPSILMFIFSLHSKNKKQKSSQFSLDCSDGCYERRMRTLLKWRVLWTADEDVTEVTGVANGGWGRYRSDGCYERRIRSLLKGRVLWPADEDVTELTGVMNGEWGVCSALMRSSWLTVI